MHIESVYLHNNIKVVRVENIHGESENSARI